MDVTHSRPKLRWPLDIRVVNLPPHDGADVVSSSPQALVIQCPLGVSQKPLALLPAVGPILAVLDGELSFQEIAARFAPQGLQEQTLRELLELLDTHLFLANNRFFAAEREVKDTFQALSTRPAALAGYAYPAAEQELAALIDGVLAPLESASVSSELACLVAPHIDYRRGGVCYGRAYPYLATSSADTYILMGTAHQYSAHMFHLSAKDFESPVGRFACDTESIAKLAQRYGVTRSFADEYLHRKEHSLELQLPFMSRVAPRGKIMPILVGSFHRAVASGRAPSCFDEYSSFAGALAEIVREKMNNGDKVCFVAGVDMSHIGPQFGDEAVLTPDVMAHVGARDQEYLHAIANHDAEALFKHIAEDGDARRVCGFPTMYTILDVLKLLRVRVRSEFTYYDQAIDYQGGCGVTFAGMALTVT